eukprot:m.462076 g.462076  ORF g.462076 m.462076 type:complete len:255 (+) comp22507_c0_seq1:103-867(+)
MAPDCVISAPLRGMTSNHEHSGGLSRGWGVGVEAVWLDNPRPCVDIRHALWAFGNVVAINLHAVSVMTPSSSGLAQLFREATTSSKKSIVLPVRCMSTGVWISASSWIGATSLTSCRSSISAACKGSASSRGTLASGSPSGASPGPSCDWGRLTRESRGTSLSLLSSSSFTGMTPSDMGQACGCSCSAGRMLGRPVSPSLNSLLDGSAAEVSEFSVTCTGSPDAVVSSVSGSGTMLLRAVGGVGMASSTAATGG